MRTLLLGPLQRPSSRTGAPCGAGAAGGVLRGRLPRAAPGGMAPCLCVQGGPAAAGQTRRRPRRRASPRRRSLRARVPGNWACVHALVTGHASEGPSIQRARQEVSPTCPRDRRSRPPAMASDPRVRRPRWTAKGADLYRWTGSRSEGQSRGANGRRPAIQRLEENFILTRSSTGRVAALSAEVTPEGVHDEPRRSL